MARPRQFEETEALEQALQVFWRKGYAATSVADLQAAMNLNAPSLYATFGDKRRLFLRALRSYQYRQEAGLQQVLLGTDGTEPVKSRIRRLLQGLIDESVRPETEGPRNGCFMVNSITELANRDEDVQKIITEHDKLVRGTLANLIRQGQKMGQIAASKDADGLAAYLFTLLLGLRVTALANPDREMLEKMLEPIIDGL